MQKRWCFSALIIILTFFGAVYQQQTTIPNQEIVLQFTDIEITSNEAENAVLVVTNQLHNLGVDNIQIDAKEDGKLVLSYYSDVDIIEVKTIFSKSKNVNLGVTNSGESQSKFPSQEHTISYNLDIYEIQSNNNDITSNLNGSLVEINSISEQLLNPNTYLVGNTKDDQEKSNTVTVAFKVNRTIAIAIDNRSRKIPEVRAGPLG